MSVFSVARTQSSRQRSKRRSTTQQATGYATEAAPSRTAAPVSRPRSSAAAPSCGPFTYYSNQRSLYHLHQQQFGIAGSSVTRHCSTRAVYQHRDMAARCLLHYTTAAAATSGADIRLVPEVRRTLERRDSAAVREHCNNATLQRHTAARRQRRRYLATTASHWAGRQSSTQPSLYGLHDVN